MKKVFSVLEGIGVYLAFLLLPGILLLAVQLLAPGAAEGAFWVLQNFSTLITAAVLLAVYRLAGKRVREAAGWPAGQLSGRDCLAAFLLGICGNAAISAVLNLLPASWVESYGEQSSAVLEGPFVLILLTVVILAPLCEEIIFRGLIFRAFRRALPFGAAGALSALLFGAAHVHPLWVCYAFGMGFAFSVMVERKGSLGVSAAAHFGFNLMSLLTAVIASSRLLGWIFYGSAFHILFWGVLGAAGAVFLWRRFFGRKA